MKNSRLKIIILLITLAMICLIFVQAYWIVNAINIEEERFGNNVREALEDVVKSVEKEETARIVIKSLSDSSKNVFVIKDSVTVKKKKLEWNENFVKMPTNRMLSIIAEKCDSKNSVKVITYDSLVRTMSSNRRTIKISRDSIFLKKTELVRNVVEELTSGKELQRINERISKNQIDSLLWTKFSEKGIVIPYFFTVRTVNNDRIIFSNILDTAKAPLTNSYKIILFPGDIFAQRGYLSVSFPEQTSFVIKNISFMLGISALVLIIIVFLFYKTVQLLIKQKNLADIRSDLINNITHEFKTPLATVSLACEALVDPQLMEKKESFLKYVGIIRDENIRLQSMVENVLNTSLFENGGLILEKTEIDFHQLIRDLLDSFEMKITDAYGNITTELGATNFFILGDNLHLRNAIGNLIDNALKYSDKNPVIKIKTYNRENKFVLEIEDQGIGIPKHHLNKIFETFYRVPTGNVHNVKGYGIGLSYTKKVVTLHNGEISVESKPGKGSIFKIEFTLSHG